jgi:predicted acetyltransferase
MGLSEKAFSDFKQLIRIDPTCFDGWMGLGDYWATIN